MSFVFLGWEKTELFFYYPFNLAFYFLLSIYYYMYVQKLRSSFLRNEIKFRNTIFGPRFGLSFSWIQIWILYGGLLLLNEKRAWKSEVSGE